MASEAFEYLQIRQHSINKRSGAYDDFNLTLENRRKLNGLRKTLKTLIHELQQSVEQGLLTKKELALIFKAVKDNDFNTIDQLITDKLERSK